MKKTSKKAKKVKKGTKASGHRGTKAKKKAVKKGTKAQSGTPAKKTQVSEKPNEKTAEEELTTKQKLFGDEYLKDLNGARAYADVYKCPLRAAGANASRLIQMVRMRAYLQRKIADVQAEANVSIPRVLLESARIAMADPLGLYKDDGTFRLMKDIPVDLRRAISGFKAEYIYKGKGKNRKVIGQTIDVKLCSKDKQIEHLFKYNGLFEKDNDQTRTLSLADIAALVGAK